jgi:HprK-related kinase A
MLTKTGKISQFVLHTQPFRFYIRSNSETLQPQVSQLYPAPLLSTKDDNQIIDFVIDFNRNQFSFSRDYAFRLGSQHFRYTPQAQMLSVLEWGMNWCISSYQNRYLCLHAAVLEKNGRSLILPAPPGSGKSTLCAILMLEGWRLLSDEHCLLDPETGLVVPCVRPVSLKNSSLTVIQQRYPEAQLKGIQQNTFKGTMGYLPPTEMSWAGRGETVAPSFVIFPKYQAGGADVVLEPIPQSTLMMELAINSFNYSTLGLIGFETLSLLSACCKGYRLTYADTDQMLQQLQELLR